MQAVEKYPADVQFYRNLGVALRKKGNVKAAIAHYRESLRVFPEHSSLLNNLAYACAEYKDRDCAREMYERSIEADTKNLNARYYFANFLASVGEIQYALEVLEEFKRYASFAPWSSKAQELRERLEHPGPTASERATSNVVIAEEEEEEGEDWDEDEEEEEERSPPLPSELAVASTNSSTVVGEGVR